MTERDLSSTPSVAILQVSQACPPCGEAGIHDSLPQSVAFAHGIIAYSGGSSPAGKLAYLTSCHIPPPLRMKSSLARLRPCSPGMRLPSSLCRNTVALPVFSATLAVISVGRMIQSGLSAYTLLKPCTRSPCLSSTLWAKSDLDVVVLVSSCVALSS